MRYTLSSILAALTICAFAGVGPAAATGNSGDAKRDVGAGSEPSTKRTRTPTTVGASLTKEKSSPQGLSRAGTLSGHALPAAHSSRCLSRIAARSGRTTAAGGSRSAARNNVWQDSGHVAPPAPKRTARHEFV